MGPFDQHARIACKMAGAAFYSWMLRRFAPKASMTFDRWADARRLAVAPGLERVNDLVAVLRPNADPAREVFLVTEVETEPRRHQIKRLGIYALLLSIEESVGRGSEDEPTVGGCLLTLTGKREPATVALALPGVSGGITVEPIVVNFSTLSAAEALDEIKSGATDRTLLPWVPLMAGGGDVSLIERWKELAQTEPDTQRRGSYGYHALMFAELSPALVNWQQALEGWEMRESQVLLGFTRDAMLQGEVREARYSVLEVLKARFNKPVPDPIRLAVEGTNDLDILRRWLRAASQVQRIEEFGAAMVSAG